MTAISRRKSAGCSEEGAVQATVGMQPYRQGADAMKTLLARLLFQTVPAAPCLYMEDEIKVKYNL